MRRAAQLAAALALAAAWVACPREEAHRGDAGASGQPPLARGVKIPRIEGWSARPGDGVLVVGPPGRDVLRIEVRRGQGGDLPSAEGLVRDFQGALPGVATRVMDNHHSGDSSISIFELSGHRFDGGLRRDVVMLGAKRADGDLFLCSTAPGASEEEVKAAAEACEKLAYPAP